jgi:glycosyltransferase involved in cell wall biosynthesis
MAWYKKYLGSYGFPPDKISPLIFEKVSRQLKLLQSDQPLVTVSVIAYNEEKHLVACLWSLSEMECKYPVEIIGVNNNSTDRTEEIYKTLAIPYYNEEQKGPGFARQCGLNHAKGKYYICIDADTLYPPYYVETHLNKLKKVGTACTMSLWSFFPIRNHSRAGLLIYEMLRDIYLNFQFIRSPELCVRGMTLGFNTEWARKIGFRTDIKRGEDGSLALGLKKYGKITFVRSRKARAITGYGTIGADGSLLNSFKMRLTKGLKASPGLFFNKDHYDDKESNLIDKTNRN